MSHDRSPRAMDSSNRRIVICFYTLDIKTPLQLITLNDVKGTSCDLFGVSMGISHGKLTSLNAVSHGKRIIHQGKRASPCKVTRLEVQTCFSCNCLFFFVCSLESYNQDSTTSLRDIHYYNMTCTNIHC